MNLPFRLASPIRISPPPEIPPVRERMRLRFRDPDAFTGQQELEVLNPWLWATAHVVAIRDTTPGLAALMEAKWIFVEDFPPYLPSVEVRNGSFTVNFQYKFGESTLLPPPYVKPQFR